MSNITTPQMGLTPEQQALIRDKIQGTSLETMAVLSGILENPVQVAWREAQKAFVTNDPDTINMKGEAMMLSSRDEPVLITGESGTGKELIARILHGTRQGEFVGENMTAIVDTLFESELFGHTRGAFTGATHEKLGLIQQANGGTLFLDEIGDMPLSVQSKLLRVIQTRKYRKVGSTITLDVKCRFVAATHRNLAMMVKSGQFREDLYHRLNVFTLHIKPLRSRLGDGRLIIGDKLWDEAIIGHCEQTNTTPVFSGNVRQLLNTKLRYEVFNRIRPEDII